MKKCSDCKIELNLDNFPYDKSRDRFFSVCKDCTAIRTEAYRQKHPEKWREASRKHSIKYNSLVNEWKSQGCIKCGDKRTHVIDCHHKDPATKSFSIGTAIRGIKPLQKELAKCIPLCSNCHRDFHFLHKKTRIPVEEYVYLRYK